MLYLINQGKEISSAKPDLKLLLQVLAEQKRFIER